MQSGAKQSVYHLRGHKTPVRNHAPRKFHVINGPAALHYVFSHKRLATGDDDHYLVRVIILPDSFQHFPEIPERHVWVLCRDLAVASAMAAFHIAAQGGFPEELFQGVFLPCVLNELPVKFKSQAAGYGNSCHNLYSSSESFMSAFSAP